MYPPWETSQEDSRRIEKPPGAMGGPSGYLVGPAGTTLAPAGAPYRVSLPPSGSFLHHL